MGRWLDNNHNQNESMARIGDTLRPELGKTDARAIAQGGAAMGRGLAGLGAGIGDYLKQQKEQKRSNLASEKLADALVGMYGEGNPIGDHAAQASAFFKDENNSFKDKTALGDTLKQFLPMAIQKQKEDFDQGIAQQHADINRQNAEINKGRAGREESEFRTKESDQRAFTAASQFLANEFDPNRPPESRETMLEVFAPENPKDRETYMGMVAEGMRKQQAIDAVSATKRAVIDPAEKARRRVIGVDVGEWESKGRNDAATQMKLLSAELEMAEAAEKGGERWVDTGSITSLTGPWGQRWKSETKAAQQRIQGIVGSTLRATLGSAFTEKEGERIFAQSFDPTLPEEENVKKLRQLVDTLQDRINNAEQRGQDYHSGNWGAVGGATGTGSTATGTGTQGKLTALQLARWIKEGPEAQKKSDPEMTGDAGPLGARDDVPPPKNYSVFSGTRDQVKSFRSQPGGRFVSLDFNDADNKSARGIEIKVPSDATKAEIEAAEQWAKKTQQFLASKGVKVPIRHGNGVKRGGRGKRGVFHTEPFFASNAAARNAIASNGQEYASILGSTLGTISGVTFIAPHTQSDPGTTSGDIGEREFAMKYIIPHLSIN